MGMSASQIRYLMLTARKSNLEFEAQQISQARAMLAQSTEQTAKDYTKKMSNTALYYNPSGEFATSYPRLTYQNLTGDKETGEGLGCRLVTELGLIAVPEIPNPIPDGMKAYNYLVDARLNDPDYLSEKIKDGTFVIQEYEEKATANGEYGSTEGQWVSKSLPAFTEILDTSYTEDDALAEAEYTQAMETYHSEDKILEMRLTQIQTEHQAIETEIDSVTSVLKKNIESTFKTFNA